MIVDMIVDMIKLLIVDIDPWCLNREILKKLYEPGGLVRWHAQWVEGAGRQNRLVDIGSFLLNLLRFVADDNLRETYQPVFHGIGGTRSST